MGVLDEMNKKSNIEPARIMYDLHKWTNDVKATMLMIESALMTMDAYFEEVKK